MLGYNDEFETLIDIPVIKERVDYLSQTSEIRFSKQKPNYTFAPC